MTELPGPLSALTADGRLLFAARGLRLFASGLVSVVLAVYLAELGLSLPQVGAVFTAALVGSAATTVVVAAVGDRVGRRRLLMAMGGLMAFAGAVFALTGEVWLLVLAALVGVISPGGGEVGSSLALEQAALAETTAPADRTGVFAWANLVASAAVALGALGTVVPVFAQARGLPAVESYRLTLGAYALAGVALVALFARLSPAVEPARDAMPEHVARGAASGPPVPGRPRRAARWLGLHRSRGIVARFAGLLALNSFAAGFVVQSFVAYWFRQRFGTDLATLGVLFFCTQASGALSYLAAARIAARIGLVNTMVFTHLPSNVLLMLVPAMPTFPLAAAVLVARHALSQMDRPARESYTMAVVAPDERTAAAGFISVATDLAASAALAVAGVAFQSLAPGVPFVVAGGLRCAYNAALYLTFRDLRPPEEVYRAPRRERTGGFRSGPAAQPEEACE